MISMDCGTHAIPIRGNGTRPLVGCLLEMPLFEGLEAAAVERIASVGNEVNAPSGTVIFKQGDACRGLYIVVSGQVKLALGVVQGDEQVVQLAGPGGILGETSMFLEGPHVLTAEALADTRLVYVSRTMVMAELERTPEFARRIIANLSRRLQHLLAALEDCTLRSGTERVIGYLLNRLPDGATDGQAMVTLPAKKGIIASQLNLTHEHFSRILRALATEAMIEVDGRTVHIRDMARLRTYSLES
jgi:CRP/FNR family transcriptional regulator, dissimilatory nitrate respiration regulator